MSGIGSSGLRSALIVLICLGATGWLSHVDLLWTWDRVIYDWQLRRGAHDPGRDIVIVSIDERSLIELGRWPWPRRVHAELLDRLTEAGARGVVLDLILSEPDRHDPVGDRRLADAVAANGRVVLPVAAERQGAGGQLMETLPLPALTEAAAALGHVDIDLDRDGIARALYLQAGLGEPHWPHLALALLRLLDPESWRDPPGARNPSVEGASPYNWVRDHRIGLSFAGPPGTFPRLSYADLLAGRVPAETLHDKLVLIGVTLPSVDDLPTPVSGEAQPMPGVEIVANALDTLARDLAIRPLPTPLRLGLALALVGLLLLIYARSAPRWTLLLTVLVLLAVIAASTVLLHAARLWLAPMPLLAGVLLSYLLWSWLRLETAVRYLNQELQRLEAEPGVLPPWDSPQPRRASRWTPPLEQVQHRIQQVQTAIGRLRGMRRFMNDSLAQMADGVIVSDTQANIVLINPKALSHLGQPADADPIGQALLPGLANLIPVEGDDWSRRLRHVLWEGLSEQFEARDAQSRDLLIHLTPFTDRGQRIRGVIITLSDISPFKISERQRREMLDFLSHDLRSPLVSIIALTQIAEQRGNSELPQQVRSAARRTLDLAESFVQLTRAEHLDRAALTEVDLVFVAESAREQIRPQAERGGIRLRQRIEPEEARVMGDGALLERALMNLLDNAVKYSPSGSEVWLGLRPEDGQIHCWVADTGPGIDRSNQERLFQRFQRLDPDPGTRGAGLGLAFVKTVVDRHGGRIEVDSESGRGSCFSMWLPAVPRQPNAAGESDFRDRRLRSP